MIETKYTNRPEVQEWINKYGYLNIHTFMVYGEISEDDINMLINGLILKSEFVDYNKMAIIYDWVSEEEARAWGSYIGTKIEFIFGGEYGIEQELFEKIVLGGIDYLRFKGEYLGKRKSEADV